MAVDRVRTTVTVRAFYTLPVERRVSGNILDNSPRLDKEWRSVRFRGVHISRPDLPWGDGATGAKSTTLA